MDHAQGRAFHHHLARAIMHLNHLAGLLPFFEPSIEWEDGMPPPNFRLEHSASRGLHTFVPLPPASTPPSMVTHAGIPSQLVVNPEPNFRPISVFSASHPGLATASVPMLTTRSPSTRPEPVANPNPGTTPMTDHPRAPTRTTIPVPVRSKQRANPVENPKPKKRQKSTPVPETRTPATKRYGHPGHLPVISDVPPGGYDSDDSDDDAESRAASTHDRTDHDSTAPTTPPGSPTLTLTPNPDVPPPVTLRLLPPWFHRFRHLALGSELYHD